MLATFQALMQMPEGKRAAWLAEHLWRHEAKMLAAVAAGIRSADPKARFSTHVSGIASTQPVLAVGGPGPVPLQLAQQALLSHDPQHPLAVHLPAAAPQMGGNAAVAVAGGVEPLRTFSPTLFLRV